jgi:hypothetical protein
VRLQKKRAPLLQAWATVLQVWAVKQGPKRRIITYNYRRFFGACQGVSLKKKASALALADLGGNEAEAPKMRKKEKCLIVVLYIFWAWLSSDEWSESGFCCKVFGHKYLSGDTHVFIASVGLFVGSEGRELFSDQIAERKTHMCSQYWP